MLSFSLWMMAQFNPSNPVEPRVTVNDATGLRAARLSS
jgi:hypothetical protein